VIFFTNNGVQIFLQLIIGHQKTQNRLLWALLVRFVSTDVSSLQMKKIIYNTDIQSIEFLTKSVALECKKT